MATILDVVTNALLQISAIPSGTSPSADDAADTLGTLNKMAAAWDLQDVHTGWVDVVLTDTFPLEDRYKEGVEAMLAVKVAPLFGIVPPAEINARARIAKQMMDADYMSPESLRVDSGLQFLPSQRKQWQVG